MNERINDLFNVNSKIFENNLVRFRQMDIHHCGFRI